jgi:hypothetical protein
VGILPSVADVDADGRTEVLAGVASGGLATLSDSTLYCHDAGANSFSVLGQAWPTARGNYARAGSGAADALDPLDDLPPGAVGDLAVALVTETSAALGWTAVGDDGLTGQAASYDLRYSTSPIDDGNFASATPVGGLAAPGVAGSDENASVAGLASNTTYYFALAVVDDAGNRSALSNLAQDRTLGGGPLAGSEGAATRVAPHPALGTARIYFRADIATPGATSRLEIYDLNGRLVRRYDLGTVAQDVVVWDGRDSSGHSSPPGVYFTRFSSGRAEVESRLVYMR